MDNRKLERDGASLATSLLHSYGLEDAIARAKTKLERTVGSKGAVADRYRGIYTVALRILEARAAGQEPDLPADLEQQPTWSDSVGQGLAGIFENLAQAEAGRLERHHGSIAAALAAAEARLATYDPDGPHAALYCRVVEIVRGRHDALEARFPTFQLPADAAELNPH